MFTSPAEAGVEHLVHCWFLMGFLIIGCNSSTEVLGSVSPASTVLAKLFPMEELNLLEAREDAGEARDTRWGWTREGTSKASWLVIGNAYIPKAGEGAGRCWDQSGAV